MKLLFSSSNIIELQRVAQKLNAAGIACRVRGDSATETAEEPGSYPGLWIQDEAEYRTACVIFTSGNARG
ncbi:MAG TPA: hypothetical protein VN578_24680 [Candidatus Binatia bacterium]|jgi:hypothetical protein|nr:hypothetical protein [Candidatus Binatia bacterium]